MQHKVFTGRLVANFPRTGFVVSGRDAKWGQSKFSSLLLSRRGVRVLKFDLTPFCLTPVLCSRFYAVLHSVRL